MTKLLLSIHVLAAIIAMGPVAVAAATRSGRTPFSSDTRGAAVRS